MKEELLTRMIRIYGFEHEAVIEFARVIDTLDEVTLETIVKAHEEFPQIEEEEDWDE